MSPVVSKTEMSSWQKKLIMMLMMRNVILGIVGDDEDDMIVLDEKIGALGDGW